MSTRKHTTEAIKRAMSNFFIVRSLVRSALAHGQRLNPYTWLHIETMIYVHKCKARPTMRELAEHLSITAPSTTSLVKALEKKGYVERYTDPEDRRVVRLRLTSAGEDRLHAATRYGREVLTDLFDALSPAELAEFERLLGAIIERWNRNSSR